MAGNHRSQRCHGLGVSADAAPGLEQGAVAVAEYSSANSGYDLKWGEEAHLSTNRRDTFITI
jgi:hypothetical protein